MDMIVLENSKVKAEFDRQTGALVGFLGKATGWKMQRRTELGLSFRMVVPLPDRRHNLILGGKQTCRSAEQSADGNCVTFLWNRLLSEHGGTLDITFTAKATLTEGGLLFEGNVENRSPYIVESVTHPCLGDVPMPSSEERLARLQWGYAGMVSMPLLPRFQSNRGYWGTDHPTNMAEYPDTPFVLIASDRQGLYAGCHDTTLKEMVLFDCQLKPGLLDAIGVSHGMAPKTEVMDGRPVHVEFSVDHLPFLAPGESGTLSPIVLQPYEGTWHKGADCYKQWQTTWYKPAQVPDWAKEVHSWQQLHINCPEDDLRCRYTDLVRFGRECAEHGVRVIQLVGWNNGGQDRGNPSHDTDPRLGSWQELHDAIAEIQSLGVKIILFSKYTWGDRSTEWFRNELVRYATKDPYGDPHWHSGYAYQTPTQLADINTRRFSPMCHLSGQWREVANREFQKTIDLGASGILYDECQHHTPARYCFDPNHGHHVPAYVYAGDKDLAEGFRRIAAQAAPDYLFAGEGCYDLEFRHYCVSYFRISTEHTPVQRYIHPFVAIMVAVAGYDDRITINQCLLYRYIISYEPLNFKGHLGEFPLTIEYGKKVDALRQRYRAYLWDAEFRDTLGASVTVEGKPYALYTVFRQSQSGKRAVVVANHSADQQISARLTLEEKDGLLLLATPETPDPQETDGSVIIPPRSVAVIMET